MGFKANTQSDFWKYVEKDGHIPTHIPEVGKCWLWTGTIDVGGYGRFSIKGKHVPAHKFSWEIVNGPMPKGLLACHRCDVRNCVNPAHIFAGTQKDNMKDAKAKLRRAEQKQTKCRNGHAHTAETLVLEKRTNKRKAGEHYVYYARFCRICRNANASRAEKRRRLARKRIASQYAEQAQYPSKE